MLVYIQYALVVIVALLVLVAILNALTVCLYRIVKKRSDEEQKIDIPENGSDVPDRNSPDSESKSGNEGWF